MKTILSRYTILLAFLSCLVLTACATPADNGLVTGGIIGGLAGNMLTRGSTVGTVAGTVGGAIIGRDMAERNCY